jgi:hypothetical protein
LSYVAAVSKLVGGTFREERRLRVFENMGLRRVLEPKRDEVKGSGENYIMRSLICIYIARVIKS